MNEQSTGNGISQADAFPQKGIYPYVKRYLESLPAMQGKMALDVPCGDGRATAVLRAKGASVLPLDLFPETFVLDGKAGFADFSEKLSVDDASMDLVTCQEGIEHLPNQLFALEEFHRVLKPGGMLIVTTPHISNLVGRRAQFVFESQLRRATPYASEEASWRLETQEKETGRMRVRSYYGHIFLVGVQRLRTLQRQAGFRDIQQVRSHQSTSSWLLAPLLLPFIALFSLRAMLNAKKETAWTALAMERKKGHSYA